MEDTIVAISTALGVGAISIVRLSGKEAINITNKCFKGKDLTKIDSHTINYGYIYNNEEIIDEVLVTIMRSPKTYTTEDIVEINCHGGIISTTKILKTMIDNGARLAEPGEFTKRAFLNGRIDLIESESVIDIINSKSDSARKLAISGISGKITELVESYRNRLLDLLSQIEVNIDYPEYHDIEEVTEEKVRQEVTQLKKDLEYLIKLSENSQTIKNGIKTVIVGKPNVGKSSILNKLLQEDKAIVTDIAGTTRDIVEGEINLDGIILNIIDTAGIREAKDVVEKIGVEKSLNMIDDADLILVVLNYNEELSKEDKEILEKTKEKQRIIVVNKNDLKKKINLDNEEDVIYINTKDNNSIETLRNKIIELFQLEKINTKDFTYLNNTRQISLANEALKSLLEAEKSLSEGVPIDFIAVDLKNCFEILGEIIGKEYTDEILDNLFKNFCVGK